MALSAALIAPRVLEGQASGQHEKKPANNSASESKGLESACSLGVRAPRTESRTAKSADANKGSVFFGLTGDRGPVVERVYGARARSDQSSSRLKNGH